MDPSWGNWNFNMKEPRLVGDMSGDRQGCTPIPTWEPYEKSLLGCPRNLGSMVRINGL